MQKKHCENDRQGHTKRISPAPPTPQKNQQKTKHTHTHTNQKQLNTTKKDETHQKTFKRTPLFQSSVLSEFSFKRMSGKCCWRESMGLELRWKLMHFVFFFVEKFAIPEGSPRIFLAWYTFWHHSITYYVLHLSLLMASPPPQPWIPRPSSGESGNFPQKSSVKFPAHCTRDVSARRVWWKVFFLLEMGKPQWEL